MKRPSRRKPVQDADLDITSFMNLMIILVPVLLMSMVFSHITVLNIKLPDISDSSDPAEFDKHKLELVLHNEYIDVNYPVGVRLKRIERKVLHPQSFEENSLKEKTLGSEVESDTAATIIPKSSGNPYDLLLLSKVLQEVKRQLRVKGIKKRGITILSQQDTDYQTIVSVMDTVRSFKAVVATSVVDAELFPEISLGDAPFVNELAVIGDVH